MNFDDRNEVLEATIYLIQKENKDVLSYYIKNNEVREFVTEQLKVMGYNVINWISNGHVYVDLKSI